MRKMIREVIGEGPDFLNQEWILFEKLAYQLSAIGRNLNQLVRAYHSDQGARITVDLSLLGVVLERTESIKQEIYRLIERCNAGGSKRTALYPSSGPIPVLSGRMVRLRLLAGRRNHDFGALPFLRSA